MHIGMWRAGTCGTIWDWAEWGDMWDGTGFGWDWFAWDVMARHRQSGYGIRMDTDGMDADGMDSDGMGWDAELALLQDGDE